jgi:aspartyl-tRNA(Asn)/glutamyl-tRNA(Gln) amidotransferase subunit C|tara:strand:+ start:626 stop:910 length:285 start_codon:yes stop_codon:yes gene_type:complete
MNVDEDLLRNVAKLARLKLTKEETITFLPQLNEVLDVFSKLEEVNTDNTKSSFQPVPLKNALREDKPTVCNTQEEVLKLTDHKKDGYFKGPKAV